MSAPEHTINFRGKPACICLATWLPVYEQRLLAEGIIKSSLDIYQLIGGAAASAGTHQPGGAYDIAQVSDPAVRIAREMGAAAWKRTQADGFDVVHHHGVLRGCPHNDGGRYQIAAMDAGYNGLGKGGRGGKDTGPKVLTKRTWEQGIAWARAQGTVVADFEVCTANLMELPRHDSTVDDDLRKIQASGMDLVLIQEGSNPVYRNELGKLARLKKLVLRKQADFDVPFLYDPNVLEPLTQQTVELVQAGWSGVTPNRYMASKRFQPLRHDTPFVARDVHPIAGGFDSTGGTNRKGTTIVKRQQQWRASRRRIMKRVRASARNGMPQIIGSDTNRKKVGLNIPATVEGRKVQKVSTGFDFLYFIDGKDARWVLVGEKRVVKTHSDHDALIQRVRLTK